MNNRERRMENGEWRMENGEWRMENREQGTENGEQGTGNGEWRTENRSRADDHAPDGVHLDCVGPLQLGQHIIEATERDQREESRYATSGPARSGGTEPPVSEVGTSR
jgi:hypothetical protein